MRTPFVRRHFAITKRQVRILSEVSEESQLSRSEILRRAIDLYIVTYRAGYRPHARKPQPAKISVQKKALAGD